MTRYFSKEDRQLFRKYVDTTDTREWKSKPQWDTFSPQIEWLVFFFSFPKTFMSFWLLSTPSPFFQFLSLIVSVLVSMFHRLSTVHYRCKLLLFVRLILGQYNNLHFMVLSRLSNGFLSDFLNGLYTLSLFGTKWY